MDFLRHAMTFFRPCLLQKMKGFFWPFKYLLPFWKQYLLRSPLRFTKILLMSMIGKLNGLSRRKSLKPSRTSGRFSCLSCIFNGGSVVKIGIIDFLAHVFINLIVSKMMSISSFPFKMSVDPMFTIIICSLLRFCIAAVASLMVCPETHEPLLNRLSFNCMLYPISVTAKSSKKLSPTRRQP